MQKLKSFFYSYINSLYSTNYYRQLQTTAVSQSYKFFFGLIIVSAIFTSVFLSIKGAKIVQKYISEITANLIEKFPDDLVITVKDNVWSMNRSEPVLLATPDTLKQSDPKDPEQDTQVKFPKNLFALYPAGTIEDLDKLETFILVNEKNIIVKESSQSIKTTPITNLPNGTFNKTDFIKNVTRLTSLVWIPAVFIGIISNLIFLSFGLIYAIFSTAVSVVATLLASKIVGKSVSKDTAIKTGIHSLSIPVTINTILMMTDLSIDFPLWFILTHIVFTIIFALFSQDSPETHLTQTDPGDPTN